MKRQWFYRGSLKSCNYKCSYCPFSKKKTSPSELERDKNDLSRFVCHVQNTPAMEGAIQIVPYGEALIHRYYWEALASLSRLPRIDAIGAQSNLSFPIDTMLQHYHNHGGVTDKLRLWGTFHPEMTSIERFVSTCELLLSHHILFCVGIVGVPGKVQIANELRNALPNSIYLWVNKLEGAKSNYTKTELDILMNIDPYFPLECMHHKADISRCADNRFIEADGTMHRCNINRHVIGNLYFDSGKSTTNSGKHTVDSGNPMTDFGKSTVDSGNPMTDFGKSTEISANDNFSDTNYTDTSYLCQRKECHCYLAYCNLNLNLMQDFGTYPAFRIPTRYTPS